MIESSVTQLHKVGSLAPDSRPQDPKSSNYSQVFIPLLWSMLWAVVNKYKIRIVSWFSQILLWDEELD